MTRSRMLKAGGFVGICAAAGAAAGIAGSAAAPSGQQAHKAVRPGPRGLFLGGRGHFGAGRLGGALGVTGPPVHVEMVVPTKSNGFETVTTDRGTFQSASGGNLTISEGTKTKAYKTVTLTIPSSATVRRNAAAAKLTDLKSGDEVNVIQSPQATTVIAFDAQHRPALRPGGPGGLRGPGGPGPGFRNRGFFGPDNGQTPPGNGRQTPPPPPNGRTAPPPGASTN
jgi:hypothetical protein